MNSLDHIYLDLLALQKYLEASPKLLEAAQGVLDSEDNEGCDGCTVVLEEPMNELKAAVAAIKSNAFPSPIPPQAGSTTAG